MSAARPLSTAQEQLKLRRLELDRAAMCQAFGIVDDGTVDVPLAVASLVSRRLISGPGTRFSPTPGGDDGDIVCAFCGLVVPDEGHSWEECAKGLLEDRNRVVGGMCDDIGREISKSEELVAHVELLERENAALRLELNRPREATVEVDHD